MNWVSEQAAANLQLPSPESLVEMAIARMDSVGVRAIEIDKPTLVGLCLRLVDPAVKVKQAWQWLNTELGGSDDEQVVDDNVVYRFEKRFRPVYAQVLAEEVRRISRLAVQEFAGNTDELNRGLLSERVAEMLLDPTRQHRPGDLWKLSAIVRDAESGQLERDKLALATKQAEDRAAKLEADIEHMRAEQVRKDRRIDEQVKALQARIDELSKRAQRGDQIPPEVFSRIREELAGIPGAGVAA
ncbi:MAG: hypothetical protein IT445_00030 [Phycisphaeraceae bacterium]|nr:hypothetical protein [Phycisphaeraceae bacterium]